MQLGLGDLFGMMAVFSNWIIIMLAQLCNLLKLTELRGAKMKENRSI